MGHRFRLYVLLLICLAGVSVSAGCWKDPSIEITPPVEDAFLARGRSLARGLASCGFCHGATTDPRSPLSGGRQFSDRYGEVYAANITPSKTGIGSWRADQVVRAVRSSISVGDKPISREVHRGYDWMSDNDLLAVVAYLRSQPGVEKEVERRNLGFVDRNTTGLFESRPDVEGYVPQIDPSFEIAYGRYLVDNVSRCGSCHNTAPTIATDGVYLGGGKAVQIGDEEKFAPGIGPSTVDGIGAWSEAEILTYLKTGRRNDLTDVDSNFCPVRFFANGDERDLVAIVKYLKSLPIS